MSINLNEKIRERDLQNLSRIKYSRIRSIRTLKVFLLMPLPIGAILYTIWQAVSAGLPGNKAPAEYILMNLMMELGNVIYIAAVFLLLAVFYMAIPMLLLAGWLSYRASRTGNTTYQEAAFMTAVITALCYAIVTIFYNWSLTGAFDIARSQIQTLLPILIIAVLTSLICTYILRALNEADLSR